jgi:acyl-CoA thioesterase FadM
VAETFPWIQHEQVRFRDCDAMGHVNNAVYSTYLEQARIGILGGLMHQIWTGDRLVADAKSVLVGYDYTVGASVPLTENQRRRLAA